MKKVLNRVIGIVNKNEESKKKIYCFCGIFEIIVLFISLGDTIFTPEGDKSFLIVGAQTGVGRYISNKLAEEHHKFVVLHWKLNKNSKKN